MYFEITSSTLLTLIAAAILVIILSMYYFAEHEYIPPDEGFDDIMDKYSPEENAKIKMLRIRRQQLESEISAVDARVLEIQNTDLGGHSAAYFTAEMNKLAIKRTAIQNKLDIAIDEEVKAGKEAGEFANMIQQNS